MIGVSIHKTPPFPLDALIAAGFAMIKNASSLLLAWHISSFIQHSNYGGAVLVNLIINHSIEYMLF